MTPGLSSQPGVPNPRQLAVVAAQLAEGHRDATQIRRGRRSLAAVLTTSGAQLTEAYDAFARASAQGVELTAGADWILDNFYVLRDQRAEVLRHLRGKFFSELPHLRTGPYAGYPRIYHVAVRLLESVDNAVDAETLTGYLAAYQTVCPLSLGELWAIPDVLRVGLLHRLQDLATLVRTAQQDRERAKAWAERIREASATDPVEGTWEARSMVEELAPLPATFVQALIERLQGDPTTTSVVEWLERRLASRAVSLQEVARTATQRQISVAHAVSTLRWTSDARWGPIIEGVSLIEHALRQDPARIYSRMDFETRDRYRHTVEDLARYSGVAEIDVAEAAIARCHNAEKASPPEHTHVGYHLIGRGARRFEEGFNYRPPLRRKLARLAYRRPKHIYLGVVTTVTVLAEWAILAVAQGRGVSLGLLALVLMTALLPCIDFAVAVTNRLVAWIVPPRPLPKMDVDVGIGPDCRTLVAVPTLLRSPEDAQNQVQALEIHARGNPSPLLRFALLTDFADAPEAHQPEDEAIVAEARARIRELNERERDGWGDRFFLLHRKRSWNEADGLWMGWERKRGKIEELNALLRDPDATTNFSVFEGDFASVSADDSIRYVISLDADTRMPPDTAVDLIRTAAHPLNRPVYDPDQKRVIRGYGILQPRVSISPRSAAQSWFARLFSGNVGLDPYTTAVSDAYQDLFREGIYTGKGLYDVDAFSQALHGVVPANTVLSHDLLESTFARAALVTDIEVYDDYPADFISYIKRLHRWVRGDWQILRWLRVKYIGAGGVVRQNPITVLGRWQILDNVRRSLTGPAMLLFLVAGWVALPRSPIFWTGVALAILAFPVYVNLTAAVFARPQAATWTSYFGAVVRDLRLNLIQTGLTIVLLAQTALYSLDAIGRVLWRMVVTRRHMLEWTTASDVQAATSGSLREYWAFMWPSILWAAGAFALVLTVEPRAWVAAAPFVTAWIAAPWVAWRLSLPVERVREQLSASDESWLRDVGRRTWSYFERHVGPDTLWLPPDNVQENPYRGAALRTSPTNIGLGLLATQTAADFGWIGERQMLDRLEAATRSIDGLEKHGGHLLNWYDTSEGRTLWPRYVSTVDSGNFAASLVALEQSLRGGGRRAWPNPNLARGLGDSVSVLREYVDAAAESSGAAGGARRDRLQGVASRLETVANGASAESLPQWLDTVDQAWSLISTWEGWAVDPESSTADGPALRAMGDLRSFVHEQRTELGELLPWWAAGEPVPSLVANVRSRGGLERALTDLADTDPRASTALESLRAMNIQRNYLADWCTRTVRDTDFSILYDRGRELFAVGFDLDNLHFDASYYDLLASEARLASYIAIALGHIPATHWFRLGRRASEVEGGSVLLSWSGTMFEYLMPLLFTPSWRGTLLNETYVNAVLAQKKYGLRANHPWGISESAYNTLNLDLDYQYRAFGVPGLGLKRGLGKDYVVAPYASALALMVLPASAVTNLKRLEEEGAYGEHGFYDAVDYTPSRLPPGEDRAVVQNWMAHHQAMVLLSISNVLDDNRVQRRFRRSPMIRAAELLIQERVPARVVTIDPHPMETTIDPGERRREAPATVYVSKERLDDPSPVGALLSNGRYSVLYTHAGTGVSRYRNWELTRWTPDRVRDQDGIFLYIRDLDSGRFWSVTPTPVDAATDRFDTWFHLSKVESALVHDWIEAFVETCVSPEDDVEIRRLTITNYGNEVRRLDVTSYIEIVLNEVGADRSHPAFSKLFVQTEAVPEHHALLATRRPRQADADQLWMFHTVATGTTISESTPLVEYETDRARFIGRRRTLKSPAAVDPNAKLTGSVGPVLDPIFSIRQPIELAPQQKAVISFTLGVAATREAAVRLADRHDNPNAAQRVIDLATAYGPAETEHLALSGDEALRLQALGTAMLYSDPRLRCEPAVIERNRQQQSGLWAYGISGDVPLVVVKVRSTSQMDLVREAIRAFEYWRLKGLDTDLVFLNQHPPSYLEGLQDLITQATQASLTRAGLDFRGKIHVLRADQLPSQDVDLILTVARAVFESSLPGLTASPPSPLEPPDQAFAGRRATPEELADRRMRDPGTSGSDPNELVLHGLDVEASGAAELELGGLDLDNEFGGYARDGSYVIRTGGPEGVDPTPLPWINVVANPSAGFVASESGGGFTWTVNSHENRLSPWSNDPVSDRPSEVVYVRDDESGVYGSVTSSPAPLPGDYETRHSFGKTRYLHRGMGLEQELTLSLAESHPVKIFLLRIRNTTEVRRRLSVFHYHEWVMGIDREVAARYVVTRTDPQTGALIAENHYNQEFAGRVAFVQAIIPDGAQSECTGDRVQFLGRGRDVGNPRAVAESLGLEQRLGAGFDPCSGWRVSLSLEPGEESEVAFILGESDTAENASALLDRFGTLDTVVAEVDRAVSVWNDRLARVEVQTPSTAVNHALDGWFMYQNLSCRIWGRSAFYQSGGAYGFRDQLQDVMALVYLNPQHTRDQILLHAAHQFTEGDVLHWWHPPSGRGVRTLFSDDLLWLPYVTSFYIRTTGDAEILKEKTSFITARPLEDGEHEAYLHPETSTEMGDLYDHCCRALDRSLTEGAHGLPLMGAGDWNDGMSRVGIDGGESVWLGFFIHSILRDFIPFCHARNDEVRAARYQEYRTRLGQALNEAGWDGEWYRRAYYGDGTPLGSKQNTECRIDAIAQGWSVLSGVAPDDRARSAMAAVEEHLVDRDGKLIRLLTPPFDQTDKDPGYIKGYVPGVRENGGQYTHGVLWAVQALAEMGEIDRALKLFEMMAPSTLTATRRGAEIYKLEPYVTAADVYSVPPHVGRGGWSWYTGSAGWMLRVALESILGFTLVEGDVSVRPRLPAGWPGYRVRYRPSADTRYDIEVTRASSGGASAPLRASLDGSDLPVENGAVRVPIEETGRDHAVVVVVPQTA